MYRPGQEESSRVIQIENDEVLTKLWMFYQRSLNIEMYGFRAPNGLGVDVNFPDTLIQGIRIIGIILVFVLASSGGVGQCIRTIKLVIPVNGTVESTRQERPSDPTGALPLCQKRRGEHK